MLTAINILRTLAFCEGYCFAKARDKELMDQCQAIMQQQTAALEAARASIRLLEADAWPLEAHHCAKEQRNQTTCQ